MLILKLSILIGAAIATSLSIYAKYYKKKQQKLIDVSLFVITILCLIISGTLEVNTEIKSTESTNAAREWDRLANTAIIQANFDATFDTLMSEEQVLAMLEDTQIELRWVETGHTKRSLIFLEYQYDKNSSSPKRFAVREMKDDNSISPRESTPYFWVKLDDGSIDNIDDRQLLSSTSYKVFGFGIHLACSELTCAEMFSSLRRLCECLSISVIQKKPITFSLREEMSVLFLCGDSSIIPVNVGEFEYIEGDVGDVYCVTGRELTEIISKMFEKHGPIYFPPEVWDFYDVLNEKKESQLTKPSEH